MSRSAYYDWRNNRCSKRKQENAELDSHIRSIFNRHQSRYGSPRITKDLQAEGISCSKNRVSRRMKEMNLKAKAKRKFKVTTDSRHENPVHPNILQRDFTTMGPNQKWVSDISYVWTEEGWLYLCVFIDLWSRSVIGWSMGKRINRHLVCDALTMALWRRKFPKNVIVHSDRGAQYASKKYRNLLLQYKLTGSMSRKGDCWDNAVAESFFHTLKTELINSEDYQSRSQAKRDIFEYIEVYYNRLRRHSSISYCTPMGFEKMNYNLRTAAVR